MGLAFFDCGLNIQSQRMSSELKELALWYQLLGWLDKNKKQASIIGVIILAVGVSVAYYFYHQHRMEQQANRALLLLDFRSASGATGDVVSADEYLQLAEDYSGTSAAIRARLLAAGEYFTEGNYQKALESFERFISNHGGSKLLPIAMIGKASSLDALGRSDEALQSYQRLLNAYGDSFIADQARFRLAGIYVNQDKPAEAMPLLQEVVSARATGTRPPPWMSEAQRLLSSIREAHPELARRAEPAAASPTGAFATNISMLTNLPGETEEDTNTAAVVGDTNATGIDTNAVETNLLSIPSPTGDVNSGEPAPAPVPGE